MIVRENIFEKFKEDSDPVKDMGIGMLQLIDKWLELHWYPYALYDWEKDMIPQVANKLAKHGKLDMLEYIIDNYNITDRQILVLLMNAAYHKNWSLAEWLISKGISLNKTIELCKTMDSPETLYQLNVLKQKFKSLTEKFADEDSDPIEDMDIGEIPNIEKKIRRWKKIVKQEGHESASEGSVKHFSDQDHTEESFIIYDILCDIIETLVGNITLRKIKKLINNKIDKWKFPVDYKFDEIKTREILSKLLELNVNKK